MKKRNVLLLYLCPLASKAHTQEIKATWESMAENDSVPEWFRDGKIGIWMHWGIPSSMGESRPTDGSHRGCSAAVRRVLQFAGGVVETAERTEGAPAPGS